QDFVVADGPAQKPTSGRFLPVFGDRQVQWLDVDVVRHAGEVDAQLRRTTFELLEGLLRTADLGEVREIANAARRSGLGAFTRDQVVEPSAGAEGTRVIARTGADDAAVGVGDEVELEGFGKLQLAEDSFEVDIEGDRLCGRRIF